jgi:phosphoserine phosphatase
MNTSRVALLDWDYTLRRGFTLFDWCTFLNGHQAFDVEAAERLSAYLNEYGTQKMSYSTLWKLAPPTYGMGIRGQSVDTINELAKLFVEQDASLFQFTEELLQFLIERDLKLVVVSGAPEEVLDSYRGRFGWTSVHGVAVDHRDGVYRAELLNNPATAESKSRVVQDLAVNSKILIAFGDSEADIPMLNAARVKVVVGNEKLVAGGPCVLNIDTKWRSEDVVARLRGLLDESPSCIAEGTECRECGV